MTTFHQADCPQCDWISAPTTAGLGARMSGQEHQRLHHPDTDVEMVVLTKDEGDEGVYAAGKPMRSQEF